MTARSPAICCDLRGSPSRAIAVDPSLSAKYASRPYAANRENQHALVSEPVLESERPVVKLNEPLWHCEPRKGEPPEE